MEERRESTQDREKARDHDKEHAKGCVVSVSTVHKGDKESKEEKRSTCTRESTSKRMAKHIQKRGKTCLRQLESSGEGKQQREEVSN